LRDATCPTGIPRVANVLHGAITTAEAAARQGKLTANKPTATGGGIGSFGSASCFSSP
jgi:hypothetical protein